MAYPPRLFISGEMYSITFRTLEGLPFIATLYMDILIRGILARAQRDFKIILSHFLWMGNHPHIEAVFKDPEMAKQFYSEVQKKLTDSLKALLGLPHLRLWEGRPVVARVLDLDAAIERIAYLYANPSRAHLVDSIHSYPGCSSWSSFLLATASSSIAALGVDASVVSNEFWVPTSKVPLLPSRSLSTNQDVFFTQKLKSLALSHNLELLPNAWMKCFGITSPEEVAQVNQRIFKRIEALEQAHRETRAREQKSVIGERRLREQPIFSPHVPKDRATRRRVYVISTVKELRIEYIERVKELCKLVRGYYQDLLKGIHRVWPPGMFKPPLRPLASALA